MADKKISELTSATALQGEENIVVVQSSSTKQSTISAITNYIVPMAITAQDGQAVDLNEAAYDNVFLFKFTWTGGNGSAVYTLPDATAHTNRIIRFIGNGSLTSNQYVDLAPKAGQTIDGSATAYRINKTYEGIAMWSDGTEWYVIQKKG